MPPQPPQPPPICAIDFGTSNSAVALPMPGGRVELAAVEAGHTLLPTAVFYDAEEKTTLFGRAAMQAYVGQVDGRLMRSMKSVLGSGLMDSATDIGAGRSRAYVDVLGDFLRHLKTGAEAHVGQPIARAVLGRPVYFVDDDPVRDAKAQATLHAVATRVGFEQVQFQLEPLAAAFDLEQSLDREALALIADFGGGTCDFSLVRLGGENKGASDRSNDVLAHHGIHVAGTDFDRRVSLAAIMPSLGAGSRTPQGREVPSRAYHDLATWHLINTVYAAPRVRELADMRGMYTDRTGHERLMRVLQTRSGHALAGLAEAAKVQAADTGLAQLDLAQIEAGLHASLRAQQLTEALDADLGRIAHAALECLRRAGLQAGQVELIYFTGGSSRLKALAERVAAAFPSAKTQHGDSFASVAKGLGVFAGTLAGKY